MKARETIYLCVSFLTGSLIQRRSLIRVYSLFSFPSESHQPLDPTLRRWFRRFSFPVAGATLLLLFGVNFVWSLIDGRAFVDADPATRNFFEDWPNIVNYIALCPLYVTLSLAFLIHIRKLRSSLQHSGLFHALGLENLDESGPPTINYVASVAVVIAASSLSISFFLAELPQYRFLFWFQGLSVHGERVLNSHGYYYLITNLFLNLVVLMTAAAHFELFAVAAKAGRELEKIVRNETAPPGQLLGQEGAIEMFRPFSSLYLLSKVLILVIIANMYTWRAQQPDFTGMLDLSIIVVALLGLAVVSYPRYHLQYWLFRLWRKHGIDRYPELRPPIAVGVASLADIVVLGGATTNLIAYVLEKSGVQLVLF